MKRRLFLTLPVMLSLIGSASAQQNTPVEPNVSQKTEIQEAIRKGTTWLKAQQNKEKGYWSEEANPAITALAISAIMGDPERDKTAKLGAEIEAGYKYLRSCRKEDGGIYVKGLGNYNTSLALMAFLAKGGDEDEKLMLEARKFIIGEQQDYAKKGEPDNPMNGGIGYGGSTPHSDLSNTTFALEAIYYSKSLLADRPLTEKDKKDLDWGAAINFVSRCQNLPTTSGEWASDDEKNKGGFVYFPGDSKAGKMDLGNGKTALRSYGSMSYAGLLSFIYAGLSPDDQRVKAVLEWLGKNYTLDENPGLGPEGLYYYYHTMAKALSITKMKELKLANGKTVNWREDLSRKLLNQQNGEGSWLNKAGRWKESDKIMVTAYALLSLEHIYRGL